MSEMNMAMPMNNDKMDPDEGGAERTSNVTDYKRTCIDFIEDISGSYLEWVDYYSEKNQIDKDEDKKRRTEISSIVERTNTWLAKVPTTIKAIDVVMESGTPDALAISLDKVSKKIGLRWNQDLTALPNFK